MSNQLGPVPAPQPTLTEGHQRPYHSNGAAPSQGDPAMNPRARTPMAMGEYASPARRVPRSGVPVTHLEHGVGPRPTESVSLSLTAVHPANGMNQGVGGQRPEVTIAIVDAARAAASMGAPDDFAAPPAGARGMHEAGAGRGDQLARTNPQLAAFQTPTRPAGPAAVPWAPEQMAGRGGGGGQLQGAVPDVQPPGWQFSTRGPNDGQSRFGRGRP